jgi:hypothetical protein
MDTLQNRKVEIMKKILMVSMLIALALVVAACTPAATDTAMDNSKDVMDNSADDGAMENSGDAMAEDTYTTPTLPAEVLSEPVCTDERTATVIVTNNGAETWNIEALEFRLNEAIDASPECDKAALAPGEETTCSGLDQVPMKVGASSTIQLFTPDGEDHVINVRCTE